MKRISIGAAVLTFCIAIIAPAHAAFHLFRFDQVYSNADGTIQYVVLREITGSDGEGFWAGQALRATPTGGEKIAARWADHRNVPQIPFQPDWTRHKKAAPFKRNDEMLSVLPKGVIVLPGTGIQDNLRDKAKAMGLKVWDFRQRGGA